MSSLNKIIVIWGYPGYPIIRRSVHEFIKRTNDFSWIDSNLLDYALDYVGMSRVIGGLLHGEFGNVGPDKWPGSLRTYAGTIFMPDKAPVKDALMDPEMAYELLKNNKEFCGDRVIYMTGYFAPLKHLQHALYDEPIGVPDFELKVFWMDFNKFTYTYYEYLEFSLTCYSAGREIANTVDRADIDWGEIYAAYAKAESEDSSSGTTNLFG